MKMIGWDDGFCGIGLDSVMLSLRDIIARPEDRKKRIGFLPDTYHCPLFQCTLHSNRKRNNFCIVLNL